MFDQYVEQRTRGHEGFGAFNGKHLVKAALESRIVNWLSKKRNESDMLLFHHRFPTSTINVRRAAHPFTTKDFFGDTEYVLVHNGIISNPNALKGEHEQLGISYSSQLEDDTFNDSESLLWDFALTMEGKQDKLKAYGGIAFIAMKLVAGVPTHLYFARNTRPLNMFRDSSLLFLSSAGEGDEIESDILHTFNYSLKRMTRRHFKIHTYNPDYTNNNWDNQRWNYGREWYGSRVPALPSQTQFEYKDEDGLDFLDFAEDGTGWYDEVGDFHPWTNTYDDYPSNYVGRTDSDAKTVGHLLAERLAEQQDVDTTMYDHYVDNATKPTKGQVDSLMWVYLTNAGGYFEDAVADVQDDIDFMTGSTPLTQARVNEQLKLEMVIATLENDLEYEDAGSQCSSFQDLTVDEEEYVNAG